MIDPIAEQVEVIDRIRHKLPGKPTYHTVMEWWRNGRLSDSGVLVKLETVKLTNGRGTSLAAYKRFIAKINDGANGEA